MSHHWTTFAIPAALLLAAAQVLRGQDFPWISERQYVEGSAKVVVTDAFTINEDVKINTPDSLTSRGVRV